MSAAPDSSFPRLVSLACHDLRTPLATVLGFARTLTRLTTDLPEQTVRYLEMMESGAEQLVELLDELALAARIEGDRYDPNLQVADTAALAQAAAEQAQGAVGVSGEGESVTVDVPAVESGLAAFAECALRHGRLERVELAVEGRTVTVRPVSAEVARIALGEELKDFGAAVATRLVGALGGSVAYGGDELVIELPGLAD